MSYRTLLRVLRHHTGSTVIFVAIAMVALLSFAALAIDLGYLYTVRGELQNAADAGALAGAQVLYDDPTTTADTPGSQVYAGADDVAKTYVSNNPSEHVQANWETVERGHWSFATHTFTPNNSLIAVPLWNVTTGELDANTDFINAVRVVTVRKEVALGQPPDNFFAKILGIQRSQVKATAVGYIGFAGTLEPEAAKQPIAICRESIIGTEDDYTCGVGRMINSGSSTDTHQSGGWTNFSQPCETANKPSVDPYICSSGNDEPLLYGAGMGTVGGQVQNLADSLRACWSAVTGIDSNRDGWPDEPWELTLPVIKCPANNVSPCSELAGAVTVKVIWITRTDKNQMNEIPRLMGDWPANAIPAVPIDAGGLCAGTTKVEKEACWNSFVKHFNLKIVDQVNQNTIPASYEDKALYFLPDCSQHVPVGVSGGQNFGILAKIPVLVK